MRVTLAKSRGKNFHARSKSWQKPFMNDIQCKCGGNARLAFVCDEGREEMSAEKLPFVCRIHKNKGKGAYWPHDCIAVAIYICQECFEYLSVGNQA